MEETKLGELIAERNKLNKLILQNKARIAHLNDEIKDLKNAMKPKLTVLLRSYCSGNCQETTEYRIIKNFKNRNPVTKSEIKAFLYRCFPGIYNQDYDSDEDEDECDECDDIDKTIKSMIEMGTLVETTKTKVKVADHAEEKKECGSNQDDCKCKYPKIIFRVTNYICTMSKDRRYKPSEYIRNYNNTPCHLVYNGTNFNVLNLKTGKFLEWSCGSGGSGFEEVKRCPKHAGYLLIHPDSRKEVTVTDLETNGIPFTKTPNGHDNSDGSDVDSDESDVDSDDE